MNYKVWYRYYPTKEAEEATQIKIEQFDDCASKQVCLERFEEWIKKQSFGGEVAKIVTGGNLRPVPTVGSVADKLKSMTITKDSDDKQD